MSRLPVVSARQVEGALLALGFARIRQRGSHVFYRHADGRTTTVPHHAGRDIAPPLLREIAISPDDFIDLLRRA